MLSLKRVYDSASPSDGFRVLVDRLWPRGLTKEAAAVDLWAKELAPSDALRRWFATPEASFAEFRRRYEVELAEPALAPALESLRRRVKSGPVTLLYAKRETQENNATVLRDVLHRT